MAELEQPSETDNIIEEKLETEIENIFLTEEDIGDNILNISESNSALNGESSLPSPNGHSANDLLTNTIKNNNNNNNQNEEEDIPDSVTDDAVDNESSQNEMPLNHDVVEVVGLDFELSKLPRHSLLAAHTSAQGSTGGPRSNAGVKRKSETVLESLFVRKARHLLFGPPPKSQELSKSSLAIDVKRFAVLGNLQWWISDSDIRDGGSAYGAVRGVKIFEDDRTGLSTGVALVEFDSTEGKAKAFRDSAQAWGPFQNQKSVHIFDIPDDILSNLQAELQRSRLFHEHQNRNTDLNENHLWHLICFTVPCLESTNLVSKILTLGSCKTTFPPKNLAPNSQPPVCIQCRTNTVIPPQNPKFMPLPIAIQMLLNPPSASERALDAPFADGPCDSSNAY